MKSIRKTLLLSAFCFLPITFFAQPTFIKHYVDNAPSLDNINSVMTSYDNGDVLMVTATHQNQLNRGGVYIKRRDEDGNGGWTKYYEASFCGVQHEDIRITKCIQQSGFTYVIGFHGKAGIVMKVNSSNGNLVWEKSLFSGSLSGNAHIRPHDIILTSGMDIVIAGFHINNANSSNGIRKNFISKIDQSGNNQWFKTYNQSLFDNVWGTYEDQLRPTICENNQNEYVLFYPYTEWSNGGWNFNSEIGVIKVNNLGVYIAGSSKRIDFNQNVTPSQVHYNSNGDYYNLSIKVSNGFDDFCFPGLLRINSGLSVSIKTYIRIPSFINYGFYGECDGLSSIETPTGYYMRSIGTQNSTGPSSYTLKTDFYGQFEWCKINYKTPFNDQYNTSSFTIANGKIYSTNVAGSALSASSLTGTDKMALLKTQLNGEFLGECESINMKGKNKNLTGYSESFYTVNEQSIYIQDEPTIMELYSYPDQYTECEFVPCANPFTAQISSPVSTTLCPDEFPLNLNASVLLNPGSTASTYTYDWYANGTLMQSSAVSNYSAQGAGSYMVIINSADGCADTATIALNQTIPLYMGNIHILSTPCYEATLIADLNALAQCTNICWYEQSNPGNCLGSNTQLTVYTSGTYCLEATDPNGCLIKRCITVNIYNPNPVVPIDSVINLCTGTSIDLAHKQFVWGYTPPWQWVSDLFTVNGSPAIGGTTTVSGPPSSVSYTTPPSTPGSVMQFTALLSNLGSNIITYTYTDENGCESEAYMEIYVIPDPIGTIDPIPDMNLCSAPASFIPTYSNNDPNASETLTAFLLDANLSPISQLGLPIFDPSTGEFNPVLAGPGNYTIVYYTSNICGGYSTQSIFTITDDNYWHQTTKNTFNSEVINDVITDADGNVYVVGTFTEQTTLNGGGNPDITITAPIGNTNSLVAKYDPCGSLIWAARATAMQDNKGNAITLDENSNMVYITGYMSDYIELHSAQSTVVPTGTNSILLPSVALKGYVAQFDMTNGALYFVEEVSVPIQTGMESFTECRAITVDETNGDIYVGGRRCDAAYNGSAGTPKSGYFVYKYSPSVLGGTTNTLGSPVWTEYYPQYFYDQINDMDFDEVHNRVWFTGKFHKAVYHNTGGITGFNHDAFIGAFNGTTGASVSIGGLSSWRAGKCTINGIMDGNGVSIDATSGIPYFAGTYKCSDISNPFQLVSDNMTSDNLFGNADFHRAYFVKVDIDNANGWCTYGQSHGLSPLNVYGIGIGVNNQQVNFCGDTDSKRLAFYGSGGTPLQILQAPMGASAMNVYTGAWDLNGQVLPTHLNMAYGLSNISSKSMTTDEQGHSFVVGEYHKDLTVLNGVPSSGTLMSSGIGSNAQYINGFVMRGMLSNGELRSAPAEQPEEVRSNLGNFEIYPNPFESEITIELNGGKNRAFSFAIINSMGSCVRPIEEVSASSHTFKITDLPSGMYFVQVQSGFGHEMIKIIKK